jgi:hypothetical protein
VSFPQDAAPPARPPRKADRGTDQAGADDCDPLH